ncbi:hypothetical protein HG530_001986 [Fusarium avenaceum]|nr:hypothetical protein HG530_001986 [Fusarium avenaceum]
MSVRIADFVEDFVRQDVIFNTRNQSLDRHKALQNAVHDGGAGVNLVSPPPEVSSKGVVINGPSTKRDDTLDPLGVDIAPDRETLEGVDNEMDRELATHHMFNRLLSLLGKTGEKELGTGAVELDGSLKVLLIHQTRAVVVVGQSPVELVDEVCSHVVTLTHVETRDGHLIVHNKSRESWMEIDTRPGHLGHAVFKPEGHGTVAEMKFQHENTGRGAKRGPDLLLRKYLLDELPASLDVCRGFKLIDGQESFIQVDHLELPLKIGDALSLVSSLGRDGTNHVDAAKVADGVSLVDALDVADGVKKVEALSPVDVLGRVQALILLG